MAVLKKDIDIDLDSIPYCRGSYNRNYYRKDPCSIFNEAYYYGDLYPGETFLWNFIYEKGKNL